MEYDDAVLVLSQMFPFFQLNGIERALLKTDGDIDKTVDLLKSVVSKSGCSETASKKTN